MKLNNKIKFSNLCTVLGRRGVNWRVATRAISSCNTNLWLRCYYSKSCSRVCLCHVHFQLKILFWAIVAFLLQWNPIEHRHYDMSLWCPISWVPLYWPHFCQKTCNLLWQCSWCNLNRLPKTFQLLTLIKSQPCKQAVLSTMTHVFLSILS